MALLIPFFLLSWGIEVAIAELDFICEVEIDGRYGRDRSQFFELHFDSDPSVTIDRREVIAWDFCPADELASRALPRNVRAYLKRRADPRPTPPHPGR